MEFLVALAIALGLNLAVFFMAYTRQTDKLTDITYTATFLLIALAVYLRCESSIASMILVLMVTLWALRLGTYLGIRIHKIGRDKRFDKIRGDFWRFGRFWLLQGLSVWVIMLPVIYLLQNMPAAYQPWASIGLAVWAGGLLIEAIADQQKFSFLNKPSNRGKWIASGLWNISRHPNYLGEILVWLGIYLFALPYLAGWQALIALTGPLWIAGLLIFISGIPPTEKSADKKWGHLPAYKKYKKNTPVLIPGIKL